MSTSIVLDKHEMVVDKDVYETMVAALETVEAWKLPEAYDKGKPCSFEYLHGSNGAREHIRSVARKALSMR